MPYEINPSHFVGYFTLHPTVMSKYWVPIPKRESDDFAVGPYVVQETKTTVFRIFGVGKHDSDGIFLPSKVLP